MFLSTVSLLQLVFLVAAAAPTNQDPVGDRVDNAAALSWYSPDLKRGNADSNPLPNGYTCYKGSADNFPKMSTWISFHRMWSIMVSDALTPVGDSVAERQAILGGIINISRRAKVDARVILAVIILESTGNVRVGCTNNGVENCGIMQSYNPANKTYDPDNMQASIMQMIVDGTQGTKAGPSLVQHLNEVASGPGNLWMALRLYNSGSVNGDNLSEGLGATSSYVSNIANFLQGWNGWGAGASNCDFE